MGLSEKLKAQLVHWLNSHNWEYSEWVYAAIVAGIFLVTAVVLHFLLHSIILRAFKRSADRSQLPWGIALHKHHLLSRIALVFQGFVLLIQARIWLPKDEEITTLITTLAYLWIFFYLLLSLFALLNFLEEIFKSESNKRNIPYAAFFKVSN